MGAEKMAQWTKRFLHHMQKKTSTRIKKKKRKKKNFKNVLIFETKSQPCSPGWPGTHYANTPYPMF